MTLLVTPQQANLLDLGQNKGTLHLALRNPEDNEDAQHQAGDPGRPAVPPGAALGRAGQGRARGAGQGRSVSRRAAGAQGPGAASRGLDPDDSGRPRGCRLAPDTLGFIGQPTASWGARRPGLKPCRSFLPEITRRSGPRSGRSCSARGWTARPRTSSASTAWRADWRKSSPT